MADIDNFVGIAEDKKENNISWIYPNPAADFVCVENDIAKTGIIEIRSLAGKSVKIERFSTRQKIDISELNPGIYILKMSIGGQQYFKKLIKE